MNLVLRKIAEIKPTDTDWYGKTVAWVYVEGKCVNEEIIRAGLAWHYKKYSKDRNLDELGDHAREKKTGL